MSTIVTSNLISLDGYVAGPGGDMMVLPMDHSFDAHNADLVRRAETVLLGATTYRFFVSFWPHALEMPGISDGAREIAEKYAAGMEIVVVSDSLTPEDCGPWAEQTRIVPRADAHRVVAELRSRAGGDVVTFGSATLVNDLLTAGLVDEVHTLVGPVVLGAGVPFFGPGATARLERTAAPRTWEGSGNVLTSYAVVR